MLTSESLTKLESLAQEVAKREGCELYDIEFGGHGGRRTLRVFIDRADGGIGIDDCSNVSRGLSLLLDVEDPIPGGAYDLEVSSPGVDRFLRKPWHFERVIGKKIQTRLAKPLEAFGVQNKKYSAMKQVTAVLTAADAEGITFEFEEEKAKIPFSALEKAKVVFDFDTERGAKKGEKKKK